MSQDYGAPSVPLGFPSLTPLLQWMRTTILNLQSALIPPGLVSNLRATGAAGANIVDFTRADGDSYTLYINTAPSINFSERVQLGQTSRYTHNLGAAGELRYYAVRSKKGTSVVGELSAWVSATTLALNAAITPPDPPPATEFPITDQETASIGVSVPDGGEYDPV